jgi:thiol-disulfide isomerase/thioredoxin
MTMKPGLILLAAATATAGAGLFAILNGNTSMAEPNKTATPSLPIEGSLPSLQGATGWLNSAPLTRESLRGKVVVVDIWTYTCINWLRTLPHVRAWAERYKDRGLVVIGVHSPEFSFEGDIENVRRAVKDMRIAYPVAIDTDFGIWRALHNSYWPALYVADVEGRIRYHHFGEGAYEESEKVIERLLDETGKSASGSRPASVDARGIEIEADWNDLQSPETYLGRERAERFEAEGSSVSRRQTYTIPPRLPLHHWAISGDWTVGKESIVSNQAKGRIAYRFHARDVHLVMGPATRGTSVRFRVLVDGQPPAGARGADVDEQGNGTVSGPRLYQLIRQPKPIIDRQFEIEFLDAGAAAFAFTFG